MLIIHAKYVIIEEAGVIIVGICDYSNRTGRQQGLQAGKEHAAF